MKRLVNIQYMINLLQHIAMLTNCNNKIYEYVILMHSLNRGH